MYGAWAWGRYDEYWWIRRGRAGQAPRTDALMELLHGYAADAEDPGFGKRRV